MQLGSKIEPYLDHKNKIKQTNCLPISINWSPNSNANYYFGTTRSMIGYNTKIQVTNFRIKKNVGVQHPRSHDTHFKNVENCKYNVEIVATKF